MDFDIKIDLRDFEREIAQAKAQHPQQVRAAMSDAGWWLYTVSLNWLTRYIYGRDIPRWQNGNAKWRRSYTLRNAERLTITVDPDGVTALIFTDPATAAGRAISNHPQGYSELQHNREKPIASWRKKAYETGLNRAVEKFRTALQKR